MNPLRNDDSLRDFRALWFGQSVSMVGDRVSVFILPTIAVLTLGASSLQVGALNAVSTIAYPILGLFAGVLMDRVRRRPAMLMVDATRLLIYASLPIAAAFGVLTLTQLFVVGAIAGACTVLFDVAYQSFLPSLVASSGLGRANTRLETSAAVARLVGPSLGGVVLQASGAVGALIVNAASFLASITGVGLIRAREERPEPRAGRPSVGEQIQEGTRFLWRHPLLRPLTISAGLRNLGMNANRTVLIVFLYQGLHLSSGTAGALFAVGAAAAVTGSLAAGRLLHRLGVGSTLLLTPAEGVMWMFAPLCLLGLAVPILVVIMFLSSFWLPIWNATVITLRQGVTPATLLGRVNATARTVNLSTIPVGALLGGLLADAMSGVFGTSVGLAWALCGCSMVAATSLIPLSGRRVRTLRSFPSEQQRETTARPF